MIVTPSTRRSFTTIAYLLCAMASTPPLSAQTLGQGEDTGLPIWRVVAALIICLALAVGAAFALKARLNGRSPTWRDLLPRPAIERPRLRMIETLRINHRTQLYIVACDERELLLSASDDGIRLLEPLPVRDVKSNQGHA